MLFAEDSNLVFQYLDTESYEENFQRWWKMNTLEREMAIKYFKSDDKPFTKREDAFQCFDKQWKDKRNETYKQI